MQLKIDIIQVALRGFTHLFVSLQVLFFLLFIARVYVTLQSTVSYRLFLLPQLIWYPQPPQNAEQSDQN